MPTTAHTDGRTATAISSSCAVTVRAATALPIPLLAPSLLPPPMRGASVAAAEAEA